MRWPFVQRSTHKAQLDHLAALIESQNHTILAQSQLIHQKNEEIKALVAQLSDPKCNALHSEAPSKPKKTRTSSEVLPIRGGWRAMSEQYSNQTIPTGSDSIQQLEQRVEAQGGTK